MFAASDKLRMKCRYQKGKVWETFLVEVTGATTGKTTRVPVLLPIVYDKKAKLPAPTYPCFACQHCFATQDNKTAAKMEAAEMEAAKTEAAKTEAAKTEAAKTEAAETNATVTDVSKDEEESQKKDKDERIQVISSIATFAGTFTNHIPILHPTIIIFAAASSTGSIDRHLKQIVIKMGRYKKVESCECSLFYWFLQCVYNNPLFDKLLEQAKKSGKLLIRASCCSRTA
jgi:hypothetical protein